MGLFSSRRRKIQGGCKNLYNKRIIATLLDIFLKTIEKSIISKLDYVFTKSDPF